MSEQMTKQNAIEMLEISRRNGFLLEDSATCKAIDIAIDSLKQQTKEHEQRRGRWIETKQTPVGDTMYCDCKCSICNFQITRENGQYPRFCENCGSYMIGGE